MRTMFVLYWIFIVGGIALGRYLLSSDFGAALLENWQLEFLEFSFFILATVWLIQRGSTESKNPEEAGLESLQKQRMKGTPERTRPCGRGSAACALRSTRTR